MMQLYTVYCTSTIIVMFLLFNFTGILCGECEEGQLRTVLADQCRPHSSCLPKASVYLFIPLSNTESTKL